MIHETLDDMGLIDRDTLTAATPHELLAAYESILVELRRREIVRTNDAPLGQWAEWLARDVLGGVLERNSSRGYDLVTPEARKVQIKARLVRNVKRKSERQLSVFRSFDFHDCLVLLFDPDYAVRRAALLSMEAVQAHARFRKHVNGSVLFATEEILQNGTDLTQRFR